MGTLAANAIAPGLLDRYLGRTGFKSQQTKQPQEPDAPVNLWEPADGPSGRDFGAHGIFDAKPTPATRSCGPPTTTACSAPPRRRQRRSSAALVWARRR